MIIPYTDLFASKTDMGSAVSRRIGQRQKDSLKAQLLNFISTTTLYDHLILRSGSALHGVYLHERHTEDLDFFAHPAIAANFFTAFQESGIVLTERPGGITPVYAAPGLAQARIEIGVDVLGMTYPEESFLVPQVQTFRAVSNATAPVRTYTLPALLARKLRYVMWRRYAVDFYDLWIGLEKHPECASEMQEIVRRREIGGAGGEIYWAEGAMANFAGLEETWHDELYTLMPRVPAFETVRRDLSHWLPLFEAERKAIR